MGPYEAPICNTCQGMVRGCKAIPNSDGLSCVGYEFRVETQTPVTPADLVRPKYLGVDPAQTRVVVNIEEYSLPIFRQKLQEIANYLCLKGKEMAVDDWYGRTGVACRVARKMADVALDVIKMCFTGVKIRQWGTGLGRDDDFFTFHVSTLTVKIEYRINAINWTWTVEETEI